MEYDNYASLNNDPLAGSTASVPTSYFAGGGSSGLGVSNSNGGLPITVDSNWEALDHYLNGNGEPVKLGVSTQFEAVMLDEFQKKHNRIIKGKTSSLKGNFAIDLTSKMFHVGRTNVDYVIKVNGEHATVTYNFFTRDGFWDVDFLDEWLSPYTMPNNSYTVPDGLGPNLERFGGTPYQYIPTTMIFSFPNPGY